jgi:hypothetical protein
MAKAWNYFNERHARQMAPTQQNPITETCPSSGYCQDYTAPYEPGAVHHHDERVEEQTQDMEWATAVLSPTSDAGIWEKHVASNMLSVLAQHGADAHIRQVAATFLANRVGVVS